MSDQLTDEEMQPDLNHISDEEMQSDLNHISDEEMQKDITISDAEMQNDMGASNTVPEITTNAPPEISRGEALLRGAGQIAGDYPVKGFAAVKSYLENKNYPDVLKEQMGKEQAAKEQYPIEYHGAGIAAMATGEGLAGKAIPAIAEMSPWIKGALTGGFINSSQADSLKDLPEKSIEGALTGLIGIGAMKILSKGLGLAGGAVKSGLSTLFGPPTGEITNYLQNPAKIKGALSYSELADMTHGALGELQDQAVKRSHEAMKLINSKDSVNVEGVFNNFDEWKKNFSQGIDPDSKVLLSHLKVLEGNLWNKVELDAAGKVTIDPSTLKNIIKRFDASIGRKMKDKMSGEFYRPDNVLDMDIRKSLDQALKSSNPDYEIAMRDVSKDFDLLSRTSKKFGNKGEDTTANKLSRLAVNPELGKNRDVRELLQELDTRMGTDTLSQVDAQRTQQAFQKSYPAGSKRTAAWGILGSLLGGAPGAAAGAMYGGANDAGGGQKLQKLLDMYSSMKNKVPDISFTPAATSALGAQKAIGQGVNELGDDMQSAANHFVQMKRDPNYRKKILEEGNQSELQQ